MDLSKRDFLKLSGLTLASSISLFGKDRDGSDEVKSDLPKIEKRRW